MMTTATTPENDNQIKLEYPSISYTSLMQLRLCYDTDSVFSLLMDT